MREQEKELFQGYEIRNWNYSPRLYKIFAAAAAFNLLAIFTVGQTNLLTKKGCDSPFVNRVCQVIDTVYIGSILLGTDSGYVDKDYVKTELEDADITYIDVSGQEPPLSYPEGYFALANPEQFAAQQNAMNDFSTMQTTVPGIPGITTNPTISNGTDLTSVPQTLPPKNSNPIIGQLPTSPLGNNPIAANPTFKNRRFPRVFTPKQQKISNNSPNKLPNIEDDLAATSNDKTGGKKTDKDLIPAENDSVKDVEINKKPFEDLGDSINDKVAKREIDLTKPFLVILDGAITADGKLDPKKSKFVKSDGDQQMVNVAKEVIEAVGNSGFLGYLKNNGVDRVNFTMVQDDEQIYIKIISDQKTPEKAGTTASGFNTLLSGLKFADANGFKKLDDNSKTLVENSKVTSDGKNFILNFALPKQAAQEIINRTLKDRADKKATQQPNSSAEINKNANANFIK